jgi:Flp pilus assembly pilin Flp
MLWNAITRLVREDEGMEMVEWSIVGVVFALAAALLWGSLRTNINEALTKVGDCVKGTDCTKPAAVP